MKEVVVIIDTSDNTQIKVALRIDGKEHRRERPLDRKKAQVVLPLLQELLQEHKLTLQDITAIEVNPGPGSFTGLRVGITIANTFATVLQVPINQKKVGELISPIY